MWRPARFIPTRARSFFTMSTPVEAMLPFERLFLFDVVASNETTHEVTFRTTSPLWRPPGARGVFGGVFVGQAVAAALLTLPADERDQFRPHAFHSLFIRAGQPGLPVDYTVKTIRDGRNYLTREVRGLQNGEVAFLAQVLLARRKEPGLKYNMLLFQLHFPNYVKMPEDCLEIGDAFVSLRYITDRLSEERRVEQAELYLGTGLEWRFPLEAFGDDIPLGKDGPTPVDRAWYFWIRARQPMLDHPNNHAVLGFCSDLFYLFGFQRLLGSASFTAEFLVLMDHTLYIHLEDYDVSEWMLYNITTTRFHDTRALMRGEIFTRTGQCIALTVQEGLVLPNVDKTLALRSKY